MRAMPLLCRCFLVLCLVASVLPVRAQTDDPEKLITFANGLFDREMYSQAFEQYQAFVQKYPQHANISVALLRAGECQYRQQAYAEAIKFFDRCAREHATAPEADAALLRDGQCHIQLKQFTEAVAAFANLLQQFPQSRYVPQAAYWQGEAYFNLGEFAKAIDAYKTSLTKAPKDDYAAYALYSIGLCQTQLGDADAGIVSLKKVLADYPGSPLVPEVSYRIGQALAAKKRYDEAIDNYKRITQQFPKAPAAALAALGIGYCAYDKGDYTAALTAFREATQSYAGTPQASEAQVQVGNCLLRLQKYDDALAAYDKALADKPSGSQAEDAAFGRGLALQRKGDTKAATSAFDDLVKTYPKSKYVADSYLHLGDLRLNADDAAGAEAAYSAAADATKDADTKRKAHYGVVVARFKQSPTDATLAEVDKIIADNPKTDLAAQLSLEVAQVRYKKEQFPEAAKGFEAFAAASSDSPQAGEALYFAGICYDKLKRPRDAQGAYEKVVARYPKSRYADQALATLIGIYAAAGDAVRADQAAKDLREKYPQSGAIASALFNSAHALYDAKKYTDAAKAYDEVIKTNPGDDVAAQAWFGLGAARFAGGDLDGAMTAFTTVGDKYAQAEIAKSLPDALFQVGEKRFDAKEYAAAQAVYEDIIKRFPAAKTADLARYKLGWALLKQDNKPAALEPFLAVADSQVEKAVVCDARYQAARLLVDKPDYAKVAELLGPFTEGRDDIAITPWALVLLGRARLELAKDTPGQLAAASEALRAVTTRFPKHAAAAQALLYLGRAQKAQKDYTAAASSFNQAIARNIPSVSVEAQYELADCKRLQNDYKGAAEEFLKVAILYDNAQWGANAQVQAGVCYEQAGDKDNAAKAYKVVVERYKDEAEALKQAQDRLKALGQQG